MHDGVFRIRDLTAEERRLAERPRDFSRHIELQCRVEALEVWSRPVVAAQLKRCLKTLTRDAWNVDFQPACKLQQHWGRIRDSHGRLPGCLISCGPMVPLASSIRTFG